MRTRKISTHIVNHIIAFIAVPVAALVWLAIMLIVNHVTSTITPMMSQNVSPALAMYGPISSTFTSSTSEEAYEECS